jgi:hypothetical protein
MTDTIKPVAWRAADGSIWDHKTTQDDEPLYTSDALYVAVLKERERIAAALEVMHEHNKSIHNYYHCLAVLLREDRL